jgi:amidase
VPDAERYWRRVRSVSWSEWIPDGKPDPSVDVDRSLFEWDRFRRSMLEFIRRFDVVACPVAERAAGLHGTVGKHEFVYTLPFSLTGWPVVAVRAGTSPAGLPIGVQIAARPWRDDVALAVAKIVEAQFGGCPVAPLPPEFDGTDD